MGVCMETKNSNLLNFEEGKFLVNLARRSIEHTLKKGTLLDIKPQEVTSANLVRRGASFVTLYNQDGMLRGCIGSLEPTRVLVFDVLENAVRAAFRDPRFPPVTPFEFRTIKITVSVLTLPEPFPVNSAEDLLSKLKPKKHGLIIQKGFARATFLPAVWEELQNKEAFLAELCVKAGLEPDEWKNTKEMEFFVYEEQEFSDS